MLQAIDPEPVPLKAGTVRGSYQTFRKKWGERLPSAKSGNFFFNKVWTIWPTALSQGNPTSFYIDINDLNGKFR